MQANDPEQLNVAVDVDSVNEEPNHPEPSASETGAPKGAFTSHQIEVLRGQIAAFKLLSSNMPLPYNLQQLVFGQDQTPYAVVSKIIALSNKQPSPAGPQAPAGTAFPGPIPPLNPMAMKEQRNRILQARKELRIKQLESLPSNLPHEAKLRATIELKALRLLDFQQAIRQNVIKNYTKMTEIDAVSDPAAFIRPKRITMTETRLTQKLERQQRFDSPRTVVSQAKVPSEYGQQLVGKYSPASIALVNQSREFVSFHRNNSIAWQTKVVRFVSGFHSNYEKEEQKRAEKLAKDRLKALKADDEEAYFKLIDQQKDTRLTHILSQTDSYLDSLKKRVVEQRNEHIVTPEPSKPSADENGDYYAVVHAVRETVEKQPAMLLGGTLKEYQLKGLQWMLSLYNNKLNGILADEMGLGKTIQTISLITYLMEMKGQTGPFLIVVPLSTMSNWCLEFDKWAPSVVRVEYKGTPNQRKSIQAQTRQGKFNVLVTTYEYIIKDRYFLSKTKWLYLIVDEGHRMKNAQSKLSTILSQHYATRYRLILTGTPLQNNLPELWALLNFILPKIFNSSKTFDDWFNAPFANTGEKIELNEEEQLLLIRRLHKVLRPFLLRRLKKDVESELPEKVETVIKCPMSALQDSLYRMVQRSSRQSIQTNLQTAGIRKLNNTIMQLRKICNHPFVFDEVEHAINPLKLNNELLYRVCGKFELLSKLLPKLKATGHRVLIFFQMTHIMTIMEDFLVMLGYQYLRLDGSTKSDERSELLAKFNDPNSPYFIFLLSTRAGGLGLNLQTADTVIIYDSDWNPHQDLQAQDRAHRIGQTKEVRILRLVTVNSVEEYILQRARFKLNIDVKVIQAGKFDQKSTSEERDAMLRALFVETSSSTGEDQDENVPFTDEEVNELIARDEDELKVFNQIDQQIINADIAKYRNKGLSEPLPRLISAAELPPVYLNDIEKEKSVAQSQHLFEEEVQGEEERVGGRRKRRGRPAASSALEDDEMSDEEWLDKLEDQLDEPNAEPKRQKSTPTPLYPNYPSSDYFQTPELLMEWLEGVTDSSGSRNLLYPFIELPSKSEYPDYYQIIEQPISYQQIKQFFLSNPSLNTNWHAYWKQHCARLFGNAMIYNAKASQIYQDAQFLLGCVESRI